MRKRGRDVEKKLGFKRQFSVGQLYRKRVLQMIGVGKVSQGGFYLS